jgi:hypothetical protein
MSYPASESDEVPDLLCAYNKAAPALAVLQIHATGWSRRVCRSCRGGGRACQGFATGVRRNKFHIVSTHLSKRDLGTDPDRPVSRPSA